MEEMDYKELKKGGMMRQSEKGRFSVRLHVTGGNLTSGAMKIILDVAERYGHGEIHLTARQGIEIPNISQEDLWKVKNELSSGGVLVGVCGPTIRTITACQGSGICPNGILDAPRLAKMVDQHFYGKSVPHKFKIGISGCANNCIKAEENDVGIKGAVEPLWDEECCNYCGICQSVCPTKAIEVDQEVKKVKIRFSQCIYCGDCIQSCPTNSMKEAQRGFLLYAGGKFGRFPSIGKRIGKLFSHDSDLIKTVGASVEFFRLNGIPKERFGGTLERVGYDKFEEFMREKLEEALDGKAT